MTLFNSDPLGLQEVSDAPEGIRVPPPRRVVAGWVAIVLAFTLTLVLAFAPAPFVIQQPGPVFNTLGDDQAIGSMNSGGSPLISIPGQTTYPASGSLDLLTVTVNGTPDQRPGWLEILLAWFDPSLAVVPVDAIYPPGITTEQSRERSAALMTQSQPEAIAAALNSLGYEFRQAVVVERVTADGPAAPALEEGDEITSVNGASVKSVRDLRDRVAENGADAPAEIGILRDGAPRTVSVTPLRSNGQTVLGIAVSMDYAFPIEVKIQLDDVGGPSAGQMFALGIIDKLTPESLTGGEKFAGTGTVDNTGAIGGIGGIRQKMFAARDTGSRYFLAPQANCDEVTGHVPAGLQVFAVTDLDDSLKVLETVRTSASTADLPRCPAS